MNVAIAKIKGDLRYRPSRSMLILFAVTIGTSALAAAFIATKVLTRAIETSYASSLPPSNILVLGGQTDAAMHLLSTFPEVEVVEPRSVIRGRIETASGSFAALKLTVLPDMRKQSVSRIEAHNQNPKGLQIEQSSLEVWGYQPGNPVHVRLPNGESYNLPTDGVVADASVAPGVQDRIVYAYGTPATVAPLGPTANFRELHLRIRKGTDVSKLIGRLAASGINPERVEDVLQRHPHADQMQGVLVLLSAFAVAALVVSSTLISNIVSVAMRSEMKWIGLQKAIGASARRVVMTTMGWVSIITVPGVIAGLFLGALGAKFFISFAAHELNLADVSLSPSFTNLLVIVIIGIAVPLIGSMIVAIRSSRIGPLDAIFPDRKTPPIKTPSNSSNSVACSYALRQLWQKPWRVGLMLVTLSLGGSALISAGTVYRSLSASVDRVFNYRSDDIDIRLLAPVPQSELLSAVEGIPGIKASEAWGGLIISFADKGNLVTGTRFGLLAPPRNTRLLSMPVAEGRWLGGDEEYELVASRSLLARNPDIRVGDSVTIASGDARTHVAIVGVMEEATEPGVLATQAVHDALAGGTGLAGALRLSVEGNSYNLAGEVENRLFMEGIVPLLVFDRKELQKATRDHFLILLILLSTVGSAALAVGALSLWSSVSVSILERRREIAMIRAFGASSKRVRILFGLESLVLAGIAAVLAFGIGLPISTFLTNMLGQSALHIHVDLQFSWVALAIWLSTLGIVMTFSTLFPLERECRNSPSHGLSYE